MLTFLTDGRTPTLPRGDSDAAGTMTLLQQLIQQVGYHLNQAQVKRTWPGGLHSCSPVPSLTLWRQRHGGIESSGLCTCQHPHPPRHAFQCCHYKHLIRSLRKDPEAALPTNSSVLRQRQAGVVSFHRTRWTIDGHCTFASAGGL